MRKIILSFLLVPLSFFVLFFSAAPVLAEGVCEVAGELEIDYGLGVALESACSQYHGTYNAGGLTEKATCFWNNVDVEEINLQADCELLNESSTVEELMAKFNIPPVVTVPISGEVTVADKLTLTAPVTTIWTPDLATAELEETAVVPGSTVAPAETPIADAASAPDTSKTKEPCPTGSVCLDNPLASGTTDVPTIIGIIIKGILGVIGAVVLLMFIWGAQAWLMAAGNPEKIKAGGKTMAFAALGAFIVFFSYLFLNGVLTYLGTGDFPK
ncbi:MAG: hypothetical protein A3J93_02480 [Candidatus Magasanikbacteria bacterium RIFOXYC2_FULL_42_28]|uniref:Uncharacterized protein n=1 Tax=Candidatus Magasanikbacteria bacterium RIFOXYC2_FULL_42_28 TaxID=1798704 RepID=A0A1F6NWJ7_9BACT|nr:MAG: hypothetical protein A3J93_02480 [Candidatus Magasanikbacteria bacterium RIFOXYC2_FULL_42_28]